MARVNCDVSFEDIQNESGRQVPGVVVTCGRCGHHVQSFGQGEGSIKRCMVLLKEECPNSERNFYTTDEVDVGRKLVQSHAKKQHSGRGGAFDGQVKQSRNDAVPERELDLSVPTLIRENKFAVIDCETTGLSVTKDQIIQVGVVQVDFGQPRWQCQLNIRPTIPIPSKASEIHGLTIEKLHHAPTFDEAANSILAKIEGRVLLGYNIAKFDAPILDRQFDEAKLQDRDDQPMLDVLLLERKFAQDGLGDKTKARGGQKPHSLASAAERWGVGLAPKHNALHDAKVIWAVFCQMAAEFPLLGDSSLADVMRLQAKEEVYNMMGERR